MRATGSADASLGSSAGRSSLDIGKSLAAASRLARWAMSRIRAGRSPSGAAEERLVNEPGACARSVGKSPQTLASMVAV